MPRQLIKTLLLCACAVLVSCKDTIDIDLKDGEEYIVISGRISGETSNQPIVITRSSPITSAARSQPVHDAHVEVRDSEGRVYSYFEENDGVYSSHNYFYGEPGCEYTVYIEVDIDGDDIPEIFTASDIMREPVGMERIKFEKYRFFSKDLIMIVLWGQLPENDEEGGYCFNVIIDDQESRQSYIDMLLLKDELISKRTIDSLALFYIDPGKKDNNFRPGNLMELRAFAPSEQYYEFLRQSKDNISSDLPIYGGPPANSSTNIRQTGGTRVPVTGFFAACSQTQLYLRVDDEIVD